MSDCKITVDKETNTVNVNGELDVALSNPVEQSVFWKMYLRRKTGLEAMSQDVEEVAKECHFWRVQLDAIEYKNRLIRDERRSLRKDYAELLVKMRHDTSIVLKLKDSEKKLQLETEEYCKFQRKLEVSHFANKDLLTSRFILEDEKRQLLECLKSNEKQMDRINRVHKGIEEKIKQETEKGESNRKRYDMELKKLGKMLATDRDKLEIFKSRLEDQVAAVKELRNLSENNPEEFLNSKNDVSVDGNVPASQGVKISDDSDSEDKSQAEVNSKSEEMTTEQKAVVEEWSRSKTLLKVAQIENRHLLNYYSFLNSRMNSLNQKFIEACKYRNLKEAELQKNLLTAADLYQLVMQKRKKVSIPQRKLSDELHIRVKCQIMENEALKNLMRLTFAYNKEDFDSQQACSNELKEFCREALGKQNSDNIAPSHKNDLVPEENKQ